MKPIYRGWLIELLGVMGLGSLQWLLTPILNLGEILHLNDNAFRLLAIFLVVVSWGGWWLFRKIRAGHQDDTFIRALLKDFGGTEDEESAQQRVDHLAHRFKEALVLFRKNGPPKRLVEQSWYVLIGAPGSGKTTALLQSGLHYPLKHQTGHAMVAGVAGTRHCDWFFTNEAVLIDTAGRYTTQDSHESLDALEWKTFLRLLKKHRPQHPLNGIILTVAFTDLMEGDEAAIESLSRSLRDRIVEINGSLKGHLPVYLMLTKADRILGFNECFQDLTAEERTQVWGETLILEDPITSPKVSDLMMLYQRSLERLLPFIGSRLGKENNPQAKTLILFFPEQLAIIKSRLEILLKGVMDAQGGDEPAWLRGIYMTSATQNGTPIDRLLEGMSSGFGLSFPLAEAFTGIGKSYFTQALFTRVIFPESSVATFDEALIRTERRRRKSFRIGLAAGSLMVLFYFFSLFFKESTRLDEGVSRVTAWSQWHSTGGDDSHSSRSEILSRLDQWTPDDSRSSMSLGFWRQGTGVDKALQMAYQEQLIRSFKPLLLRDIESVLSRESLAPVEQYDLLKAAIMISKPEHWDADVLRALLLSYSKALGWSPSFMRHLNDLLALPPSLAAADESLLNGVRSRLLRMPPLVLLMARFHQAMASNDAPQDLILQSAAGPLADQLFITGDGTGRGDVTIPSIFTADGYQKVFLPRLPGFMVSVLKDHWVLHGVQHTPTVAEAARLYGDLEQAYLKQYFEAWSKALNDLTIKETPNLESSVAQVNVLQSSSNPLAFILETVERETTLVAEDKLQNSLHLPLEGGGLTLPISQTPLLALKSSFKKLIEAGNDTAEDLSPLTQILMNLTPIKEGLLDRQLGGSRASMIPNRVREVRKDQEQLPEPLKRWIGSLLDHYATQAR